MSAVNADNSSNSGDPGNTGDNVTYRVSDAVATITLNRPDAMNGLNVATKEELLAAVGRAAEDEQVRCVVLTGSGRAFCVGQDLKEHRQLLEEGDSDRLFSTVRTHYNPLVTTLMTMPKPVIAAVNGVAAGAGASLAFACDFRIVAQSAGFNLAFTGIALSCDTGTSWTLQRLVGRARALELLYFPRTIKAQEALELGLATSVVPTESLASEAESLAARLAAGPTLAFGAVRRALTHSAAHDFADSLDFESEMMSLTGATQDHRNAVEAFVAKRPAEFHGR